MDVCSTQPLLKALAIGGWFEDAVKTNRPIASLNTWLTTHWAPRQKTRLLLVLVAIVAVFQSSSLLEKKCFWLPTAPSEWLFTHSQNTHQGTLSEVSLCLFVQVPQWSHGWRRNDCTLFSKSHGRRNLRTGHLSIILIIIISFEISGRLAWGDRKDREWGIHLIKGMKGALLEISWFSKRLIDNSWCIRIHCCCLTSMEDWFWLKR